MHDEKTSGADDSRALKKRLVEEGRAHAALASADALPDYRITCIFADKKPRRKGRQRSRFVAPWI